MPFDRSFLPPAVLEIAVLGDTHFIVDAEAYAVEFDSVRQWPARAAHALRCVADLGADVVVHLGDVSEEPPSHPHHGESRQRARRLLAELGLEPRFAAGNMDIGDKPDPTMFTPPVSAATLGWFHDRFGPSWHAFDAGGVRFVVLNSQILNGPLPAAAEQARWLESELAASDGGRLFLFLHMPPFFVDEHEPDTGFYNSIDEPARSWLTGLLRRHRVEAVFCGHTHFRALQRVGDTRLYVCASTTTSRAGFYEAFQVAPPAEQGRNDPDKLGFYLVRVLADGHRAHFVRTAGRTGPDPDLEGWQTLLTRTCADLPGSPLGLYLRTPLAAESAGAVAWPSVKRQRVRDDHPLLAAVELGARHVRVPASDLTDPLQSRRLQVLRDEGVAVTAVWIDAPRLDVAREYRAAALAPDTVELQLPGVVLPGDGALASIRALRDVHGGDIALAPFLPHERAPGRYHPRGRLGFHAGELPGLDRHLAGAGPVRAVGCLDAACPPWQSLRAFACRDFDSIAGVDVALSLPADDEGLHAVAGSLCAAACDAGLRLWLDPYVDLDRTNDHQLGLLDRLGNPRPAFHVARSLNTVLADEDGWTWVDDGPPLRLRAGPRQLTLYLSPPTDSAAFSQGEALVVDLGRAVLRRADDGESCRQALAVSGFPCVVLEARAP